MTAELNAVVVRATTEDDWAMLRAIRLAALSSDPSAFGASYVTAAAYSEQQWRDRASPETQPQYVVAIQQDQAVGLIGDAISPSQEYNLIAMWVSHECRGMGIADRLVDAVKTRATQRGYPRIVLSVSPDNASAVRLYRRHGFAFLSEWEPLDSQPGTLVQKMEWRRGQD